VEDVEDVEDGEESETEAGESEETKFTLDLSKEGYSKKVRDTLMMVLSVF